MILKNSLSIRISIAIVGFIVMVGFMLNYFFETIHTNELNKNAMIDSRDFYFKGQIVDIKKLNRYNNIIIVKLDSVHLKHQKLVASSPFFHGYYSELQHKIIFYSTFINETEPSNLPTYVWVSSRENRITYDKAVEPFGEISLTKIYGKYMDQLVEEDAGKDWIKF
jgi:hypothetical protein